MENSAPTYTTEEVLEMLGQYMMESDCLCIQSLYWLVCQESWLYPAEDVDMFISGFRLAKKFGLFPC